MSEDYEKKSVSRNDMGEETVYNFTCPYCNEHTEFTDDFLDEIDCEHCGKYFDIED